MRSIRFKESWQKAISGFSASVRSEIYSATLFYTLENSIPEGMSDLAMGAFAFIKADIDTARRKAERKSASVKSVSADAEHRSQEKEEEETVYVPTKSTQKSVHSKPQSRGQSVTSALPAGREKPVRHVQALRKPTPVRKKTLSDLVRRRIASSRTA
ncbi:MAG: hypothetical protein K2F63_05215 [Muribaculaceae bacterium]|nr:hypothetical protein [Muribaculaceae bacterium]MDE6134675.1 hypothetical protein [Muribaculaceae bacterium]